MPNFAYVANHDDGRVVRGTAIGATIEEVIQDLALKGMLVTKIEPAVSINDPIPTNFSTTATPISAAPAARPSVNRPAPSFAPQGNPYDQPRAEIPQNVEEPPLDGPTDQRSYFATSVAGPLVGTVPLADLQMFFRQFAAMYGAGVPMVKSLDTLAAQCRVPKLQRVIREMQTGAEQGRPVSAAMQRYPEVFTPLMVSLIRAGEEGGFFQQVLDQTASYIETEIEIRNLWRKATFYPKLIIAASIVIILGANAVIAALGKSGGLTSPLTTVSVLVVLVPILIALFLYFKIGLANPRIKYNWDAFTLKVPYVGNTVQQFAMAKFGRAFGALHQGGVSVGKAVKLAADACGNEYLRSKIYPAAAKLDQGDGIAGTLAETGAVSPIVLNMLQTGETSGEVDAMLTRAAEHYESEAKMRSNQLAIVSGVVCLLVVAVYVAYVVITAFTGIFAPLQQQVNQSTEMIMFRVSFL